ncbi:hypothetical protein NFI96_027517, partial [Prochilodus magdalenae]
PGDAGDDSGSHGDRKWRNKSDITTLDTGPGDAAVEIAGGTIKSCCEGLFTLNRGTCPRELFSATSPFGDTAGLILLALGDFVWSACEQAKATGRDTVMAALELHCGLDHGGCVWGGERVDLLDSFDSEMQEWEEQLQDMQRKIEELYKEVKARRGAADNGPNSGTGTPNLDITLLPVNTANNYHAKGHDGPTRCHSAGRDVNSGGPCGGIRNDLSVEHTDAFSHPSDYSFADGSVSHHSHGFHCPERYPVNGGQDVTLDILNGYLDQSHGNPGPRSRGNQGASCYQDGSKQWPVTGRVGQYEEAENMKNKSLAVDEARVRHVSWKDPICSKEPSPEKSVIKPPIKQKDSPPTPVLTRPTHFTESPQQQVDRKCPLVDRKCGGSPSVLRKFGAMLQENEGKTLIENGTVTTVILFEPPKSQSTPVCQRKFGPNKSPAHVPVQKCLHESNVAVELCQEPRATTGPRHVVQNREDRGCQYSPSPSYPHTKAPHRVETGANRKTGLQPSQWGSQGVDLHSDYRMVERILGSCAGSQYQGKGQGADSSHGRDSKGQFLDVMKGEQLHTTSQRSSQQVNHDSSPITPRRSFSRPARPANQRPPSRWAGHAPTAKISAPSGPMHRPPSPARKAKQPLSNFSNFNNFSLYTETVIM